MTDDDTAAERNGNDRLGTVTGPREVTFVRILPGPLERAWTFVADGDKRKLWLAGGEIEPRVGGVAALVFNNSSLTAPGETIPERFEKYAGVMEAHGRVLAWDPPRKIAFTWWGEPNQTSEVHITLDPEPDGRVRLTLVHRALKDRSEMLSVAGGWHAHLGVLVAIAEGRRPDSFWTAVDEKTEKTYDGLIPED